MTGNIKWLFFDVGSTLVDERLVYENRMRNVAKTANVTYEYVYEFLKLLCIEQTANHSRLL